MLLTTLLITACAAETAAPAPTAATAPPIRITEGSDGRLEPLLHDLATGLPVAEAGVAAALIHNDDLTIGYAGNPSFDEATLFEYGSITKLFTAILLVQLAGGGVLSLDDPINAHLTPDLQDPKWQSVTLRQLATHTSGMPRLPDNMNPFVIVLTGQMDNPYARFDQGDLEEALRQVELEPAVAIADYSNFGYGVLGYLVAGAAERDYTTLIEEELFAALGMPTARIDSWANDQQAPPLNASGEQTASWTLNALRAAGAARGSLADAIAFTRASMAACTQTDALSQANCLAQQSTGVGVPGGATMGLGWIRTTQNEATAVWHNGGTGGFTTFLGFNPETNTGLVLLSNVADFDQLDEAALDLLTTRD